MSENGKSHTYEEVARVLGTLNTELVGRILRGENTQGHDLQKLGEIADACRQRAGTLFLDKGDATDGALLEDEGARAAGLPTISEILEEYDALRLIRDNLVRSIALRTSDIIELQRREADSVPDHVSLTKDVLTPPDAGKTIEPGNGEGIMKEFQERLAMVQMLLLDIGIDPRDPKEVQITLGRVTEEMMRSITYASVFIPRLQQLIEICNEVGNRSFVWITDRPEDIERFGAMMKKAKDEYLDEHPAVGTAVVMREGWEDQMRALLSQDVTRCGGVSRALSHLRRTTRSRDEWILQLEAWKRENVGWPHRATPIGIWLREARRKLRDGGFTQEQVATLQAMGLTPARTKEDFSKDADTWITELEEWQQENTGWPSPKSSLGMWVDRARKKLRDGGLTEGQAARLQMVGVRPAEKKADVEKDVDAWITELETWRQKNFGWPDWKSEIGRWLSRARKMLRDGGLTEEQVAKLQTMGVEPAKSNADADVHITKLEEWRKDNDGLPTESVPLGIWLTKARVKLRNGGFTQDQKAKLLAMGIEPAKKNADADARIAELAAWCREHTGWPPLGSSLATWVYRARRKLKNGDFTPEQAEKLKALGVGETKRKHNKNKSRSGEES